MKHILEMHHSWQLSVILGEFFENLKKKKRFLAVHYVRFIVTKVVNFNQCDLFAANSWTVKILFDRFVKKKF